MYEIKKFFLNFLLKIKNLKEKNQNFQNAQTSKMPKVFKNSKIKTSVNHAASLQMNTVSDEDKKNVEKISEKIIKKHFGDIEKTVKILEKRGIRVHLTQAHYSSQQCPHCGHISRDNRPTQEEFNCTNCNHENNADSNSAINLKFRYTNVLLKSKLHKLDKYNRMIPKIMKKEKIKEILISAYPKVDSC